METIDITSYIYANLPDLIFVDKFTNQKLDISVVNLNPDGVIESVVTTEGSLYTRASLDIFKDYLYVPGLGNITPGSRVIYKEKDYVLCYGWHTNISNQTICTWYLEALEEAVPPKTLYKEMIDEIELVHFR